VLSNLAPVLGIPPFAIPSLVRIAKSITTITPIDIVVTLARVMAALVRVFRAGPRAGNGDVPLGARWKNISPIIRLFMACPCVVDPVSRCCGFPASNSASA